MEKFGLDPEDAEAWARQLQDKKFGPTAVANLLALAADLVQRAFLPSEFVVSVAEALKAHGVTKYDDLADISEVGLRTAIEGRPEVAINRLVKARNQLVSSSGPPVRDTSFLTVAHIIIFQAMLNLIYFLGA